MTDPVDREGIPRDRAAVAAMIQRLYVLKAQRLAAEAAAQTAGERSPPAPPVSSAPTTTTTAACPGDAAGQRRRATANQSAGAHADEQQLGLFDE